MQLEKIRIVGYDPFSPGDKKKRFIIINTERTNDPGWSFKNVRNEYKEKYKTLKTSSENKKDDKE